MAAAYVKTRHPGIYKRGSRYVVTLRIDGRKREHTADTLAAARALKASLLTDRDRGKLPQVESHAFADYALDWIGRYRGNGRRGFSEETRKAYRRDLEHYAIPFLSGKLGRRLERITPRDIDNWIAWLCDERQQDKRLADATIRRILAPVRACLATARREELIASNPADRAVLPVREEVEDPDGEPNARVFSREQLDAVLRVVRSDHRAMFMLLAGTGLRWSEVAGLRRGDLALDDPQPVVRVRQTVAKGGRFKPPKSKHGRRDVPLAPGLVRELRKHLEAHPDKPGALVFPPRRRDAKSLSYANMLRNVLRPAAEEAGASWAGFHTFRHTYASLHFAAGTNIVAVSRLLGHHSPAFTLSTYAHLIPGDAARPLDLAAELGGANAGANVRDANRQHVTGIELDRSGAKQAV